MEKTPLSVVKELLCFMRPENCFFSAGIAASGYIVFNGLHVLLLPIFAAAFMGTGASYAYNYIKDSKEDLVNKKRLNFFVINVRKGMALVMLLYAAGLLLAAGVSPASAALYTTLAIMSVLYSKNRIKEMFLVKNAYTGLVISFSFLLGAAATGFLLATMPYVAIIFMLGFAANTLGDIRGRKGDEAIGMTTLPIAIGTEKTKLVIYSLLSLTSVIIVLSGSRAFYPIVPFAALAVVCLSLNHLALSRMSMLSSFALLPLFILAGIW